MPPPSDAKPLSEQWIKQQLRLCEKATKGPWVYQKHLGCKNIGPRDGIRKIHGVLYTSGLSNNVEDRANARLCIAAREGYPPVLRQHICLTHALDTCVQALTKILEKHGRDWVQRDVIFGAEEFKQGMQAVKEACDALGYVLKIEQASEEAADAAE